jgi:hypothetical protein
LDGSVTAFAATSTSAATAAPTSASAPAAAVAAATTPASATAAAGTATTPASAAATAVTAAAARGTFFTRARFVYGESATVEGLAVKLGDRSLRVLIGTHGDECESAGFAGEFVLDEKDFAHRTSLREIVLQVGLGRIERQIADVEFVAHLIMLIDSLRTALR